MAKSTKWYAAMAARRGKAPNQYTKAKKLGLPKPAVSEETRKKLSERAKSRIISEETRKKISESRIRYLREHPDQVPYVLNHYSNGPSYAEKYWAEILEKEKIQHIKEHRVAAYSLDFAILDSKIDLEIDGDQHYLDPRIIESDKRRNEYLTNEGWTIIRVRWSDFCRMEDKPSFVRSILDQLGRKL